MNCKKIFIIFLIFITICISIKCIINKCRKPLVETEICLGNTCLEKKDLDRLLLYINKNIYSEKYEDPTPTQNNMLCIGGTCIKESDLNRMLFKSLEPNAISPTVIYSKTPLVRNTEGKDLSTPADIKRMLPNGGVIYSEEIGPITFKINSENEAFYTYPEKIQLWRSVYIVSVDLVYQSFDKSVGDALLRFNDTGNEMGNYYGLRYMETNDKWLELDPIGAISYNRFKLYDGLPAFNDQNTTVNLLLSYYKKRYYIYSESQKLAIGYFGTPNYPIYFNIINQNPFWTFSNSEKFLTGLLLIKPSELKKMFERRKLDRIFGFSDNFDYYINDIKYTTPSTHLWIAFKTSDGNIYEGLYIPKNYRYNSDDLKDPLSLLSFVRRKANFIDDTWIYENIGSYILPKDINGKPLTDTQPIFTGHPWTGALGVYKEM
jgi:hypothetical protein